MSPKDQSVLSSFPHEAAGAEKLLTQIEEQLWQVEAKVQDLDKLMALLRDKHKEGDTIPGAVWLEDALTGGDGEATSMKEIIITVRQRLHEVSFAGIVMRHTAQFSGGKPCVAWSKLEGGKVKENDPVGRYVVFYANGCAAQFSSQAAELLKEEREEAELPGGAVSVFSTGDALVLAWHRPGVKSLSVESFSNWNELNAWAASMGEDEQQHV